MELLGGIQVNTYVQHYTYVQYIGRFSAIIVTRASQPAEPIVV